ncbi:MAG: ATP-binding protein [Thermoclostridium sp.]|nr:ATP-binding protein [Thermoclostridium sp.]
MNTNWQELKREFQQRRENAVSERDKRKAEVYGKVAKMKELDRQISTLGIAFSREALNQGTNPDQLQSFEQKLNELVSSKKKLLVDHGFSENYLELVYQCKKCNDTGFVLDDEGKPGTVPCHCYRQLMVERFYDVSNLNSDGETGFEFFNESYYPDVAEGHEESARARALRIRQKCLDFVNSFEDNGQPNLYFSGPTGVGKTFLSKCIALEVLKKGHTVLYLPAPAMFDIIYRSKYPADKNENRDGAYEDILNADLLIIDDLGTESPSAAKYTELLTLLDYRSAKNTKLRCKTIVSTNLDPQDLHKVYSERIVSRILGEFDILVIYGDDIRLIKRFG